MDPHELKNLLKETIDRTLLISLAAHALLGKFNEFSAEELSRYINGKLPPSMQGVLPIETMIHTNTHLLELGVKTGMFVVCLDNKYKLTETGKTRGALWFIETGAPLVDPSRN